MILKNSYSKKNIKVAIVAIAKNESAYLADWIHHHKYFGFDGFFIGVNRTSDRSNELINKLQGQYDNIFSLNLDWIDTELGADKRRQFQSKSYAYLTNFIKQQKYSKYTHILYIDIDEFWFSKDFKTDIKSYIKSLPKFDAVSFNWLLQPGDTDPFSYPFKSLNCSPRTLVKSLIKIELSKKVKRYDCHFPKIKTSRINPCKRIDSNGLPFLIGKSDQLSKELPDMASAAFILHRSVRSEKEYIALLRRERPGFEEPIKNNRSGFYLADKYNISIDPTELSFYWDSLDKLIASSKITELLNEARKRTYSLCDTVLDIDPIVLSKHAELYVKALEGTFVQPRILAKLQESKNKIISDQNAPRFLKCAIYYQQKRRYGIAIGYLDLALLCRPRGPLIIRKLKQLKELAKK